MIEPTRSFRGVVLVLLAAASVGAIGCLWSAWCEFPYQAWNDVRLAPAFALRHGVNPYPLLDGGPLQTWIYGPVGILVNLPATFAGSARGALHAASVINATTLLAPLAVIFFSATELRARGWRFAALAFVVAIPLIPPLSLIFQVADHSAIAAGLLSCWCLARNRLPNSRQLALSAVLCVLAISSKQHAVFLATGQAVYLGLAGGRRLVVTYTAWLALFGLVALGLASWAFGFSNLWLNLVFIPGHLPWGEIRTGLATRTGSLVMLILVPALGLALLWQRELWPDRTRESGRFFQLAVLAAAALLPVGLAAMLKIGGNTNSLHSWAYLLPAFLLLWLARDRMENFRGLIRLAVVVGLALLPRAADFAALPPRPLTHHLDVATELMTSRPHTLWFPQNPVLTFYADGRLWHAEDGVYTRHVAGLGLREPDFRRHLPPNLLGVVYPAGDVSHFSLALLSEFNATINVSFWTLHIRHGAPAEKP